MYLDGTSLELNITFLFCLVFKPLKILKKKVIIPCARGTSEGVVFSQTIFCLSFLHQENISNYRCKNKNKPLSTLHHINISVNAIDICIIRTYIGRIMFEFFSIIKMFLVLS